MKQAGDVHSLRLYAKNGHMSHDVGFSVSRSMQMGLSDFWKRKGQVFHKGDLFFKLCQEAPGSLR